MLRSSQAVKGAFSSMGGVRPGSLAVVNGVTFWHSDDDRLIRITEPVFVVFTDRDVPLKSA